MNGIDGTIKKTYRNPLPTVDIIIYSEKKQSIVLIERKNEPYGLALPGGFVDYGESLEQAARREALEETGLDCELLCQFHSYSDPARDSRKHTISTVFIAGVKSDQEPVGGDDALSAAWYSLHELPDLLFDHNQIIHDFLTRYVSATERKFF